MHCLAIYSLPAKDKAKATTGNYAHAATTGDSAHAATTGDSAHVATTGYSAQAATTGGSSISVSLGRNSKAKAGDSGAIVCTCIGVNREIIQIRASKVGENGIKADTWYTLDKDGNFIEVE